MKKFVSLCAVSLFAFPNVVFAASAADAVATISAKFDTTEQVARIHFTLPKGVKFNYDGPWKLELTGPIVSVGKALTPQGKNHFNKDSGQFFFATPSKITKEQATQSGWNVTFFLCDEKNTWCKRLTDKGNFQ